MGKIFLYVRLKVPNDPMNSREMFFNLNQIRYETVTLLLGLYPG